MLHSTVRVDLDSDYVLDEVTRELDSQLVVTQEEFHDDGTLTFVADVPETPGGREDVVARFEASEAVRQVGTVGDSALLVRKEPSGAIPVIRKYNGVLYGTDRAFGTERVFEILTFTREDIRTIVDELDDLGSACVERLVRVPDRPARLTARQQEAVRTALELGYYDWPRGAEATEVAERLDVTHSTFLEHLRKGEKKLLTRALSAGSADPFAEAPA